MLTVPTWPGEQLRLVTFIMNIKLSILPSQNNNNNNNNCINNQRISSVCSHIKSGFVCSSFRQAVQNGDLKIIPEMFVKTWYKWLDNCR